LGKYIFGGYYEKSILFVEFVGVIIVLFAMKLAISGVFAEVNANIANLF